MKSLSLGLIHGKIDQVDQHVVVTWVQPRVLDKAQIKAMCEKVATWKGETGTVKAFVGGVAPELCGQ